MCFIPKYRTHTIITWSWILTKLKLKSNTNLGILGLSMKCFWNEAIFFQFFQSFCMEALFLLMSLYISTILTLFSISLMESKTSHIAKTTIWGPVLISLYISPLFLQHLSALMEQLVQPVVQAPTNAEKGKETVTLMMTARAIWNVARAVVMITTAIKH